MPPSLGSDSSPVHACGSAPAQAHADIPLDWLAPDLGSAVGAIMTARSVGSDGSHSLAPYDGFNLGTHVGDDALAVQANRDQLQSYLGMPALWLNQVHGNVVVRATPEMARSSTLLDADGSLTTEPGVICTVMVADCLPVLLAAPEGRGVAALHAGWRGLAGAGSMAGRGILESGVQALSSAAGCEPSDLVAWLGPCIGPMQFEVGADVLKGFGVDPDLSAGQVGPRFTFYRQAEDGRPRWLADLPGLARDRLQALGLLHIHGGQWCTASDASRFFSFRRDRVTGRQAACIWLR